MQDQPVVLFDGVCNFCNGAVNFMIRRDKRRVFRYAALQSDAGKRLLESYGLSTTDLNSFVLINENKAYQKSDAALEVLRLLGGGWRWLTVLRILPRAIRNSCYDVIARNRYRWFGKKETCMIPTRALRSLFLD